MIAGPMPEISTDDVPQMMALGISVTEKGDYEAGLQILRRVYELIPPEKAPQGLSSLGLCLAKVERKNKAGAELAEQAVKLEFYEGRHWANLVRIYIGAKNRRKAVEVLEKGLRKMRNDRALLRVREEIGYRKAPYFKFLPRQHPLNKFYSRHIGKLQKRSIVIFWTILWLIYLSLLGGVFLLIRK